MLPVDLSAVVADAAARAATRHVCLDEVCGDITVQDGSHCGEQTGSRALAVSADDFNRALGNMRQRMAISIGAPQVSLPWRLLCYPLPAVAGFAVGLSWHKKIRNMFLLVQVPTFECRRHRCPENYLHRPRQFASPLLPLRSVVSLPSPPGPGRMAASPELKNTCSVTEVGSVCWTAGVAGRGCKKGWLAETEICEIPLSCR